MTINNENLRKIARLSYDGYYQLSPQSKLEYYIMAKYIKQSVFSATNSETFPQLCDRWDNYWDGLNKKLNSDNTSAEIEANKVRLEELLNEEKEVTLFTHYCLLSVFSIIEEDHKKKTCYSADQSQE